MNIPRSSPERDAALDAAWSTHSRDEPPSHLDAAILAAAHRAVGSAPRDVTPIAAEATSPQRWWMPLAAAATIGAIALGILQLAPQEPAPSAPVSDSAGTTAMPRDRLSPVERKDAANENQAARAAMNSGATSSEGRPPPSAADAQLQGTARFYARPMVKQETAPASDSAGATGESPAPATRIPPPARDADAAREQRAEPSATLAKRQASPMPQPFPAEAERKKTIEADNASAAIVSESPAPAAASARSAKAPAPPSANIARDDAASSGKLANDPTAMARAPALNSPALATRASPNGGGAAPAAKTMASPETPGAVVQDPDAWVARIRKLYEDGRQKDAARELVAMRSAFPDADRRLPESMRSWAATVRR